jgi:hypothetical protein
MSALYNETRQGCVSTAGIFILIFLGATIAQCVITDRSSISCRYQPQLE